MDNPTKDTEGSTDLPDPQEKEMQANKTKRSQDKEK